jgi:glycosyltransferase involved in cell wall biosynthesis
MKVLFVSNLFPNANEPARGVFNLHQIRHLAALCDVRVVAPIAWLPFRAPFPAAEQIDGLRVEHPKQFYLPKIGRPLNAWLYARSVAPSLQRLKPFDVILVNWAYPDACGIATFGIPFVASISGSDANRYLTYRFRRRQILAMLRAARAVTTRSRALKELLVSHGADAGKIHVLYNGVDSGLFHPSRLDPQPAPPRLVYVGRLSPEKGVADLVAALAQLDQPPPLLVIGDGPQRAPLQQQARSLPVTWLGAKRNDEIAPLLRASDIVCLPSHMEGVPNAALEAFACGLPVVGTRVGGIPEIITPQTGILAESKNPTSLAAALGEALRRRWNRDAILAHAAQFDWHVNARTLAGILQQAAA